MYFNLWISPLDRYEYEDDDDDDVWLNGEEKNGSY